jgi:poly-gamma-glutamate system protein
MIRRAFGLLAAAALILSAPVTLRAFDDPLQNAAVCLMAQCEKVLWREKLKRCPDFDVRLDPEHSGLVGVEFTPLTTTLGHWRDKVVSARPSMAGAVAGYFLKAGLRRGDTAAVNASGSFPGFTLAVLCAAQVMGIEPVLVCSYGSSMYGGTLPQFTFPVMLDVLRKSGLLNAGIAALSPGGRDDAMAEVLLEDGRPLVKKLMASRHERCLDGGFTANMKARREIFFSHSVKIFVSCGGAGTSMGRGDDGPELPHGLILSSPAMPSGADRGLIYDFLERGVPVVHLLYTEGICRDWNLPCEEMADPEF